MQFHSNLAIATGYQLWDTFMTTSISIAVYSGSQPSAAEYAADLSSKYTWASGSQLLAHYGAASSGGLVTDGNVVTGSISSSTGVYQLAEPSNQYTISRKRSGTAAWAVIFSGVRIQSGAVGTSSGNALHRYINVADLVLSDTNEYFIIVPVSDLSGNGVIKFSTVEFESGVDSPIQSINFTPAVV